MSLTLLSLLTLALPAVAQKLTFTQGSDITKSADVGYGSFPK